MNRRDFLAAFLPGALPVPYRHYRPPTKDRACIRVMWQELEKAQQVCGGGQACWKPSATGNHDLIVAPKPRDFNDERRLMILGHEVLHALGAEHD
jgi:hypothetical protein